MYKYPELDFTGDAGFCRICPGPLLDAIMNRVKYQFVYVLFKNAFFRIIFLAAV